MTQREEEKACSGLELDEGHLLRSGHRDLLTEQTLRSAHTCCMLRITLPGTGKGSGESHNV